MYLIRTAFDRLQKPRPIASLVFDTETNKARYFTFYLKGTGATLDQIEERIKEFASFFAKPVILNDFKAHLESFRLPLSADYDVYDLAEEDPSWPKDLAELKKTLTTYIGEMMKVGKHDWQALAAKATVVYADLQNRGVLYGSSIVHPTYEISTYSGRSKTMGFSIQGMGDDHEINSIETTHNMMISADWIAADMRMAALMSKDVNLEESFKESDPYVYLGTRIGKTRDECKKIILPSMYAFDFRDPTLDIYPQLKAWTASCRTKMQEQGYLTSILGRKFKFDGTNERTVFNASIQGSVAHAMQNTLVRLRKRIPNCILTELYDSVILSCAQDAVKGVIAEVKNIMLRPFEGLLQSNPVFPLRVSIGNRWRAWKTLREYRS